MKENILLLSACDSLNQKVLSKSLSVQTRVFCARVLRFCACVQINFEALAFVVEKVPLFVPLLERTRKFFVMKP